MDTITIGIALGALVLGATVAWLVAGDRARREAKALTDGLERQLHDAEVARATAETRLADSISLTEQLIADRNAAFADRDEARRARQDADMRAALAEQNARTVEKRMSDWEIQKSEMLQHTKAAVLEVGNTVSTKLLADHKQETEAAKKEASERVEKATKAFGEQVELVVKSVALLNDQVGRNHQMTDTVWKALSSPGGAGHFAEIGLENCLKSFGLERARDFLVQHSIVGDEGGRLRPDAILFLPFDSALVIDSKASKFLLELAEVEGTDAEEVAYQNLARTMNAHLRSLASKDYRAAIFAAYREAGRSGELKRVLNVMYLPNDAALEKLTRCDPDFWKKAAKEQILVVGPTGLAGIIGFARVEIDLGRQVENQEHIVDAVQQLLESVGILVGHVDGVGRGIKGAADSFSKLAGSVNSRLLPRARKLAQLGVRPPRGKSLPQNVPAYQVHRFDDETTIDGQAEEISNLAIADYASEDQA